MFDMLILCHLSFLLENLLVEELYDEGEDVQTLVEQIALYKYRETSEVMFIS